MIFLDLTCLFSQLIEEQNRPRLGKEPRDRRYEAD